MRSATTVAIAAAWLLSGGCADPPSPRTAGDACESSTECESNLCYEARCLDPAADDDGDGLTNAVEAQLGTSAVLVDTDGDGLSDYAEVQGNLADPPDEDGDTLIDALESALVSSLLLAFSETDGDCLAPQKDPEDGVQNQDEAWVADLACCCYGACSKVGVEPVSYACVNGVPVCTFSPDDDQDADGLLPDCDDDDDGDQVPDDLDCDPTDATLSTPVDELCDGVDNDCDGEVDEDFKAGDTWAYTDVDGTLGLHLGDPCGAGACVGGVVACTADGGGLLCDTSVNADDELCDGGDNDCDGEVDEDWPELEIPCLTPHPDCGDLALFVCGADGASVVCSGEPASAGTACDDGNPATTSDQCDDAGNCTGIACTEGGTCRTSTVVDGACVYTIDDAACFIDGECHAAGTSQPEPDQPCLKCEPEQSQESWSQIPGKCLIEGVCYADADAHPDFACKLCDASAAPDSWTYQPPGAPCDDEDTCTTGDSCTADADCVGALSGCVDIHDCTVDFCDPAIGCVHQEEDSLCDDDVACTTDTCSVSEGCLFTPEDGLCDDGDVCTANTCDPIADCQEAWAPGAGCFYNCEVTHALVGQSDGFGGDGSGDAAFDGDKAYVVRQGTQGSEAEFTVMDWSDPSQPATVELQTTEDGPLASSMDLPGPNLLRRVLAPGEGRPLYVTSGTGLSVVDVSIPTAPSLIGHQDLAHELYGVAHHPSLEIVYAAIESGALAVADVSVAESLSFTVVDDAALDSEAFDVAVGHETLYLSGHDLSLHAYSLVDPYLPNHLSSVAGVEDASFLAETVVALRGELAVVASTHNGYRLIDVSNPNDMSVYVHKDTPGQIADALFFEGYLLLMATSALLVVDIADPSDPAVVMEVQTSGSAYGATVVGHRVLFSTTANLLQVIDLTLPCTDEEPCTLDTCHTLDACAFPQVVCDDLNLCTADSCTPGEGCQFTAIQGCSPVEAP